MFDHYSDLVSVEDLCEMLLKTAIKYILKN